MRMMARSPRRQQTRLATVMWLGAFALAGLAACNQIWGIDLLPANENPQNAAVAQDARENDVFTPDREVWDAQFEDASASDGNVQDARDLDKPDANGDADARPNINCDASKCRAVDERYIFVTSEGVFGDFARNSPAGVAALANSICKAEADSRPAFPDLAGRSWKAMLGTSTTAANLTAGTTPDKVWVRPDRTIILRAIGAVGTSNLEAKIDPTKDEVWTGTKADGTCNDWTARQEADGGKLSGYTGLSSTTIEGWYAFGYRPCTSRLPFYCFEDTP
jgi:hypothetical protein